MEDQRIARLLQAIRRRRRWRQVDLAEKVGTSQSSISRLEQGHLDGLTVGTLRRVAMTLGASARIDILWRGGLGDQLVDERHAAMGVAVTRRLQALGWVVFPEVTYQHFGERGSIDLLGAHEAQRAVCIIELKSLLRSFEETQRRLDVKGRLARQIAERRLGWRPRNVGAVLVIHDTTTNRDRASALGPLLQAGLPATSREVGRWFRDPSAPIRGLWFLTLPGPGHTADHEVALAPVGLDRTLKATGHGEREDLLRRTRDMGIGCPREWRADPRQPSARP